MIDEIKNSLKELLDRNSIAYSYFMEESYNCMLVSIFESLVCEMEDDEVRKNIKKRYIESSNKLITTQRIVNEMTGCKLSSNEAGIIYTYICSYFAKKKVRKNYDDTIRLKLLHQQNYKCNICKKNIDNSCSELDHIIPWSLVGDELGEKNLQMLCMECNRRKSKNAAYNLKMFLVNK